MTVLTTPVARFASGTSALTSVDLPTPGVPDEDGLVADELGRDDVERDVVAAAREDREVEAGEVREELGRVGQVGLRDAEHRADAGVVGGDEVAVDEADARLGVGRGHDDEHLVGVGDDDALDGVGVVGAAAEQRGARLDAHDAGEGALVAGRVADDVDAVAGDDGLLAQLAGARRRDLVLGLEVLVDEHGVAPAVDAEHARRDGLRRSAGLVFVRGRLPLGFGRTRMSASSNSGSSSSSSVSHQLMRRNRSRARGGR